MKTIIQTNRDYIKSFHKNDTLRKLAKRFLNQTLGIYSIEC